MGECKRVTILSSGRSDYDADWEVVAECDTIPGCGWTVLWDTGDQAWCITSEEFQVLHQDHLRHTEAAS